MHTICAHNGILHIAQWILEVYFFIEKTVKIMIKASFQKS